MSQRLSRQSTARRNAEALMDRAQKREVNFKLEQERQHEVIALKTARLRELRLAKEAEDKKQHVAAKPQAPRAPKPRRSKRT
jgi:hypothetical protein